MKVAVFDTHKFEKEFLQNAALALKHECVFFEVILSATTVALAAGFPCICIFTNEKLDYSLMKQLSLGGTKLLALRSAGFNHVDLKAAQEFGIKVVRVPEYSPYSVAEHAVGLILSLDRKIHKAYNRVREGNFSLDGLVGFDLHGKTIGVIGTGRIGKAFIKIMQGFGCKILTYDKYSDLDFLRTHGCFKASLDELLKQSDIVSLHVPLSKETFHILNKPNIGKMKKGAFLINTSRGGLIDTVALIDALKEGSIGAAGLDVYEEEENIFFKDHSADVLKDDVLARLMTFPNVLLTSHQGFLTKEALNNIAQTTFLNITDFENGLELKNAVNI